MSKRYSNFNSDWTKIKKGNEIERREFNKDYQECKRYDEKLVMVVKKI